MQLTKNFKVIDFSKTTITKGFKVQVNTLTAQHAVVRTTEESNLLVLVDTDASENFIKKAIQAAAKRFAQHESQATEKNPTQQGAK